MAASIITHSGWILSLLLAFGMHYLYYARLRSSASASTNNNNTTKPASFICLAAALAPTFILAAYIAAVESITSDLMGFVPKMAKNILLLGVQQLLPRAVCNCFSTVETSASSFSTLNGSTLTEDSVPSLCLRRWSK
eukprot:scaffold1579_cov102-Skeletonema_dohrnii-CCMP3373.AAC.3